MTPTAWRPSEPAVGHRPVERAYRLLAWLYPWQAEGGEELARAVDFLGWTLPPGAVVRAGYAAGLPAGLTAGVLARAVGVPAWLAGLLALATALAAVHAVHELPRTLANLRRTRALGAAPDLVSRAVVCMRIAPAPERAAAYAARTADGPLARNLREHVRRSCGTPASGLEPFAERWADWLPALRRAVRLVDAAADAPAGERGRTLDRAMDAVLEGTRDRMATFATEIRGPATALYAFGVLLPLALVSVLPAARVAGLPVSAPLVALGYDVVLPGVLLVGAVRLLERRPVAFGLPSVPASHPALDGRGRAVVLAEAGAAGAGWFVAGALGLGWARPLAAAGLGTGAAALAWFQPAKGVHDVTRALERDLPDALSLVGRRVGAGIAVERAVAAVADEVDGPTGEAFREAARRQRDLGVGVETAFVGEHGPLVDRPSPRARGVVALLGMAAREGRPVGPAAVATADHLEDLQAIEVRGRAALAPVTDTLGSTAAVFAPMVGGVTVALAGAMAPVAGGSAVPTAALGRAVGLYVLVLAAVLTGLSIGLARGLDRATVGHAVGRALLSATAVYLCSVVAAGLVV